MKYIIMLLLFCSCAEIWRAPTDREYKRFAAENRLSDCLYMSLTPFERQDCLRDSIAFCHAQGLASDCAVGKVWTTVSNSHYYNYVPIPIR